MPAPQRRVFLSREGPVSIRVFFKLGITYVVVVVWLGNKKGDPLGRLVRCLMRSPWSYRMNLRARQRRSKSRWMPVCKQGLPDSDRNALRGLI
jgi:hypothetical protein